MAVLPVFLALGGCQIFSGPSFAPSWYLHHQGPYKAPPGPEASSIGYVPGLQANADVLDRWRRATDSLVESMIRAGLVPQPFHVETLRHSNAFKNTYDYALRESLRARGYSFAVHPDDAPVLRYEAFWTGERGLIADGLPPDDLHEKGGDMEARLVLTVLENEAPVDSVAGIYRVPVYGFERGRSRYTKIYEPEPPPRYQQ